MHSKKTGADGESVACQFLIKKGYTILDRNYRRPWGEIDIIAEKGMTVRFVEVKTLSREIKGGKVSHEISHNPEDLVDERKLQKIARTAILYMDQTHDTREYQIDVVGVFLDKRRRIARCRLLEQALG